MSELIKDLRLLSDKEIVGRHDRLAQSTQVGVNHYLSELARRDQYRQTRAMLSFTKWITIMTIAITVLTIVNVIITVLLILE